MLISMVTALLLLGFLQTRGVGLSIFLRLPSTLAHELSHWVVAALTRSAPSAPSIFPRRLAKGVWQLGHVEFQPKVGRAGLVALAPAFVCFPLAVCYLMRQSSDSAELTTLLWHGILGGYLLDAAVPSAADFGIAFKDPLGLLVSAGLLYFVSLAALGVAIPT